MYFFLVLISHLDLSTVTLTPYIYYTRYRIEKGCISNIFIWSFGNFQVKIVEIVMKLPAEKCEIYDSSRECKTCYFEYSCGFKPKQVISPMQSFSIRYFRRNAVDVQCSKNSSS